MPWGSPSALQGLYAARVPIRTLLSDNFEGGIDMLITIC